MLPRTLDFNEEKMLAVTTLPLLVIAIEICGFWTQQVSLIAYRKQTETKIGR
jgi:hypothetical protein